MKTRRRQVRERVQVNAEYRSRLWWEHMLSPQAREWSKHRRMTRRQIARWVRNGSRYGR